MEFDVSIFNLSNCDREYAEYLQEEEVIAAAHTVEEAASHNPVGQSQFVCTVKQYCLSNGYLRIPNKFAKANGLTNKECSLIIRDERQRSWTLKIYTSCSHVNVGGRWGEFCAANYINVGDQIMFEVVTNGEQPIWKFHDISTPALLKRLPRILNSKRLPKQFAMANGLINKKCGLIIRDERQRSWNLKKAHNSIVHILGGWSNLALK
ncbi:hypothetical protein HAX54_006002 [Datura stramonium]|uniref:TF-B3 domain-containing protein n=1 Tax=Datura stramonium TaxID=4076 RepID=A0ABS8RLA5_DATST|nr:hypothetical protein [Datura stramonium]